MKKTGISTLYTSHLNKELTLPDSKVSARTFIFLITIVLFISTAISCSHPFFTEIQSGARLIVPVDDSRHYGTGTVKVFDSKEATKMRIPDIIKARNGDLLAFCEVRQISATTTLGGDARHNKIIMRRSTDLGKTWQPTVTLVNPEFTYMNFMNPSATVLEDGTIILAYSRIDREVNAFPIPPFGDYIDTDLRIIRSHDNGYTWSDPIVLDNGKVCSPGAAITIMNGFYEGRIIIPVKYAVDDSIQPESGLINRFYCIYSDDNGATWSESQWQGVDNSTNYSEPQIAHVGNGNLNVISRSNGSEGTSVNLAYSTDGGTTWQSGLVGANGQNNHLDGMESSLRFVVPTQQGMLAGNGGLSGVIYMSTTTYRSGTSDYGERKHGWLHKLDFNSPEGGYSWENNLTDNVQPITKSGMSNSALVDLGNGWIGLLFEEVTTWKVIKTSYNIYFRKFHINDFLPVDSDEWVSNGFIYDTPPNGYTWE